MQDTYRGDALFEIQRLRITRHAIGAIEQTDGCKNCGGFPENTVIRGQPPPGLRIVHRREIVQYQGCGVDHLQRAGQIESVFLAASKFSSRDHHKKSSNPFCRSEQTVAERALQWISRNCRGNKLPKPHFHASTQFRKIIQLDGHYSVLAVLS